MNDNSQVDNTLHDQWQAEIKSMGYPAQYGIRKVAVSNGSECAITQPYGPGALLFDYTGKASTRFLSDLIVSLTGSGPAFYTGEPAFLLGIVSGKNEIKFELKVNAQPNGTSSRLYYGFAAYKKTWLWAIPVQVTLTSKSYYANPATLPYDYYPGGQVTSGVKLQSTNIKNWLVKYNVTASHIQTFSFTPVPSVLDIGSGNVTLANADYLTRYIGGNPPPIPKNTPFQNFITVLNVNTTINNEEHLDIFKRNGDWIAEELNGNNPIANCSFFCGNSNISISGPGLICSTPQVYTLNNPPAGSGITLAWSAVPSGAVSIAPSADGKQATVTKVSGGDFTLQVTISNPNCASVISSPKFHAGGYSTSDYPVTGSSSGSCGSYVYFSTNQLPAATSYTWFYPGNWSASGYTTNSLSLFIPSGTTAGNYQVGVRVANACDAGGSYAVKNFYVSCSGMMVYEVSPNPASNDVTITPAEETTAVTTSRTTAAVTTNITEVNIYDQQGVLKKHQKFSNQKAGQSKCKQPENRHLLFRNCRYQPQGTPPA